MNINYIHKVVKEQIVQMVSQLVVASNGDPFFSKFYRKIIFDRFSGKELILQTNGVLFNAENWLKLENRYESIEARISVDAAHEETYKKLRGNQFDKLMTNLEFISALRKSGKLNCFTINFVIQKENFREMADFVRLGIRLGVDGISFQKILNWGLFSHEEFVETDVFNEENPFHYEFIEMLQAPIFKDKIVFGIEHLIRKDAENTK